eukprot:m51a1_g11305 hypothetical protein (101) ;mRNA; f:78504-78903
MHVGRRTCFVISRRFADLMALSEVDGLITPSRLVQAMPYIGILLMFIRGLILMVFQFNDTPFLTWWCEGVYYIFLELAPICLMNIVLFYKPSDPDQPMTA